MPEPQHAAFAIRVLSGVALVVVHLADRCRLGERIGSGLGIDKLEELGYGRFDCPIHHLIRLRGAKLSTGRISPVAVSYMA
jgi:hypothetical protein